MNFFGKTLWDLLVDLASSLVVLAVTGLVGVLIGRKWYSGPDVADRWQTTITRTGTAPELHENAKLHQFRSFVWGTTETLQGKARKYGVRGRIYGNNLVLTYREAEATRSDCGAILLTISREKMEGFEIGIDRNDQLETLKYTWTKRA